MVSARTLRIQHTIMSSDDSLLTYISNCVLVQVQKVIFFGLDMRFFYIERLHHVLASVQIDVARKINDTCNPSARLWPFHKNQTIQGYHIIFCLLVSSPIYYLAKETKKAGKS